MSSSSSPSFSAHEAKKEWKQTTQTDTPLTPYKIIQTILYADDQVIPAEIE
jgi:hypothetical protein